MPIFDTHRYIKQLEAAGVTTKQAEVQVSMHAEIFTAVLNDTLATKQDLREGFNASKSELRSEMQAIRSELRKEIQAVRLELKTEIAELHADFKGKFNLLYWMMGFMLAMMSAIFFKLFLH